MNLDTLLSDTATTTDPTPGTLAAARTRLDDRIQTAGVVVLAHRRRAHRRRAGLSLVGAAAALGFVLTSWSPFGGTSAPDAEAAEVLMTASGAAAGQPDIAADAAYWHTVSTSRQDTAGEVGTEHHREVWISRSGPGLLLDGESDQPQGIPEGIPAASFTVGGSIVDWNGLDSLPTDPVALRTRLLSDTAETSRRPDDVLVTMITDLLVESPASPELRAALWQVVSQVPDVRLVGNVTDTAGRPGVAVEQTVDHGSYGFETRRLVVDTNDGRLLERVDTYDGPAQEVDQTFRQTFLEHGPAQELPVQPVLPDGCTSFDGC